MKGRSDAFNEAGSSAIRQVDSITTAKEKEKIPMVGTPNSVTQKKKDGNLITERYYDEKGNAYLDIDYTDHGNKKTHPKVPHQHRITFKNGKPVRGKTGEVN